MFDPGQVRQRAELGGDRHVVIRFGNDRRFAGKGVSDQRQLGGGAHQKGIETIERFEPFLQCARQVITLAQAPLQKAAGGLGIVICIKMNAARLEHAPHAIRVRQRSVVDQTEIFTRGERMRPIRGDCGFRGHPGVSHQMRAP